MRGFTLIELVACLLIVAVLAALGGPRFFDTQPFDQRGYADELAAALRYAQGVAVTSQCNVSFAIDLAGYTATQQPLGPGNTCAAAGGYTQAVVRSDGTPLSGVPPSDANVIVASGTTITIIFGASGQVTGAAPPALTIGPFPITLPLTLPLTFIPTTVTVDPNSGFVTVQ
jgi:MSHA pilin protein MshC